MVKYIPEVRQKLPKYLQLNKLTPHQILADMKEVKCPSQATIFRWTAEVQQSRQSTTD